MEKKYEIFFLISVTLKLFFYEYSLSLYLFEAFNNMLPAIISVVLFHSFTLLLSRKKRDNILYFTNLLLTLYIISDIVYFRYYKDVLSIPILMNVFLLKDVGSSVFSLIYFYDFLLLIDLFIKPSLFYKNDSDIELTKKKKIPLFILIFSISLLLNISMIQKLNKEEPNLVTTMYSKVALSKNLGPINYHLIDTVNFISSETKKLEDIPLEEEITILKYFEKEKGLKSSLTGKYKGKNIIVIQVESLQEFVIGKSLNGNEITPNLNKFIKDSLYFENCYSQVAGGNTSDAEFILNNSFYPAKNGAACYKYYDNTLYSLPIALSTIGYQSYAFHGFEEEFWNRRVMNDRKASLNFMERLPLILRKK